MEGSSWLSFLNPIIEYVKISLIQYEDADYFNFCVENTKIREIIEQYLENHYIKSKCIGKSNDESNKKRIFGNKKYAEKNYEECLKLYTESIFYAEPNGECLPLAYGNRSLVLQQMGHSEECLKDINLAIDTGYPDNKLGVLMVRKAKCLIHLGLLDNAMNVLEDCLKKPYSKGLTSLIHNELAVIKNLGTSVKSSINKFVLPEPVGGFNSDFSSASSHLSVSYNNEKGRHVVATSDISLGDILFVEKPFAYFYFEKVCPECGKQSLAPIPCDKCLNIFYCSSECKEKFFKSVHHFECGFDELFKSVGIAQLSMRVVLAASSTFEELKRKVGSIKDMELNNVISAESGDYDRVCNLVTNIEKHEVNDLIHYIMTALLLALFMKKHTDYFVESYGNENENFKTLVYVLWKHIMQLICNGHAISDVSLKTSTQTTISWEADRRVGTAIYPSASMMNHSCEPSIINSFYRNWLIVRAAKSIRRGEEVCNCYGPDARRMLRQERQEILRTQYFFQCQCCACVQEYDVLAKFTAFKCLNCKGPLVSTDKSSKTVICLDCGRNLNISDEILEKENLIYSFLREGDIAIEHNTNLALKMYLKSWWLCREIFYKFHLDLNLVADKVAQCLAILKEYKKCILFLKCCIISVEKRYGSFTMELANELRKLGDIITQYCVINEKTNDRQFADEGLEFYNRAQKIITLLMGELHSDLNEIKENKRILSTFSSKKTERFSDIK